MPELPDITVYVEALQQRTVKSRLLKIIRKSAFVLRTADPPIALCEGRLVETVDHFGKRIGIGLEGDLWLIIHLMIAGRLHWSDSPVSLDHRSDLASFEFERGTLRFQEAGSKKRASLHLIEGRDKVESFQPPGIDPLACDLDQFRGAVRAERHTLKRFLTDQRLLTGIGNAYSDEILHKAKLSPVFMTGALSDQQISDLYSATRHILTEWTKRLRAQTGSAFPAKVTAFRKEMAAHGRYGKPCPICETTIQRIRYANNETNYCPRCQTGGQILADRALSRLLRSDWPKTIDELEKRSL